MGLIVFTIYAAAMLAIAAKLGKYAASESSFYINSRSSSAPVVAFSIVASCVGASATIGVVGLAFTVGTPAFWWLGSGAVGLSILTVVLARRVRRSQAYTLPEMVDAYLGSQSRRLISAIIVVAWTAILAAQFVALSKVIEALTGLSPLLALKIGALLVVTHTLLSGQSGIMKLDRIQCFIIASGLLLIAVWLARLNPEAFVAIRIEAINADFPLHRLLYFLAVIGGSYVVCPMLFGRLLSAESETAAKKGALWAVIGLCFASVLVVLVGLLSIGLVPSGTPADQVLTGVLTATLPVWLAYVLYLTLISALVSSADSCLITASLILSGDILQKKNLRSSRLCVACLAIAGICLTFMDKDILGFLLMANNVYVCGVVPPVFIALVWGGTRVPRQGMIMAGVLFGGTLGFLASMTGLTYLIYFGFLTSTTLTALSFINGRTLPVSAK